MTVCFWTLSLTAGNNGPQRPIDGLAHRILGDKDTCFIFVCQPDTVDFFQIEAAQDHPILITGNNDNSLAVGLNYYLKHIAGVHVSWLLCEPVELPVEFPAPLETIRKEALVKDRFFLNYCTYGYTMPWWKWPQWERFIDWMALNGITMPLAITGQEAVWYEVWKEFGMTDEEIRSYFSGPAHLPWHRMANLDSFGGPLPMSWIVGQKELQQQIVAREREFNMTPVLPAFAGHVPKRFAEMHPEADIQQLSAWCGFEPTHFLNSSDPLFAKIQQSFMEKEIALFGTDHIYGVDPFNEMDPPSWEPDYLAKVSQNIYTSLQQSDPAARWLQMTWVFYYKRKSWTPERLRSYLTAVPQDKLVLLDYFCEKTEVWRTTEGFYGQPFIWCYLGNFGGNTMLVGNINELEKKLDAALKEAGPNMTGIGSTLESFDVSPQIYEYLFDRAWESQPDVHQWIKDWGYARTATHHYDDEWLLLNDSVYKDWSFYGLGTQLLARPSLEGHGTYYTKPYSLGRRGHGRTPTNTTSSTSSRSGWATTSWTSATTSRWRTKTETSERWSGRWKSPTSCSRMSIRCLTRTPPSCWDRGLRQPASGAPPRRRKTTTSGRRVRYLLSGAVPCSMTTPTGCGAGSSATTMPNAGTFSSRRS